MSKRVVACVIARVESTRLPRKVLADVEGEPLLKRLIDRVRLCDGIDDIVLCTADTPANHELISCASAWGIHGHAGPEEDVLQRIITAAGQLGAHHLVRITGDNVFTDPYYLSRLIDEHLRNDAAYSRVNDLPVGLTGEVLSLEMARSLHSELKDPSETEYLLFYAFRPERHRCVILRAKGCHRRPTYALTVDTPRDLQLTRSIFACFPQYRLGPDIDQLIGWLDANEHERIEVDPQAQVRMPRGTTISFENVLAELDRRAAESIVVET